MKGYVYFLTNRAMPDLVKIGHTAGDVVDRIRQLNSTGVPAAFELFACFLVSDAPGLEKRLHELFGSCRFVGNREFFKGRASEFLRRAAKDIFDSLSDGDVLFVPGDAPKSHALDDTSVWVLRELVGFQKNTGYTIFDLESDKFSRLEIEASLARLKKIGLSIEKRSRKEDAHSLWRIRPEGVMFLVDHGLIGDHTHTYWGRRYAQ